MSCAAINCTTCGRDPARINSAFSECSHCECPHRRKAWSERPSAAELFRGPWPVNTSADPIPLDKDPSIHPNRKGGAA